MTAPSLTLRSLQNDETGIDISVPRFQEEEAPLGGTSILYEISVLTRLDLFKTRLHRNEDVVQFSVYKAYREIEDLFNKLNKKYPKAGLPPVPRSSNIDKYTSEEKVAALDRFVKALAKNIELCHSSIFTHFIGINSQRLPSFTTPNINPVPNTDSSPLKHTDEVEKEPKISGDLSDVFPKVKNVVPKAEIKDAQSQPVPVNKENVDLFEEVKLLKETESVSDVKKSTSTGGLFDDFEDHSLFSQTPVPKPVSPPKQVKAPEVKPRKKEPEKKLEEEVVVDDSQIIIKDRKLGDISLFDEQDLGDYITKEEEALFLVSTNENGKSQKNILLFSNESESVESDSGLHEDLDDLLNLNPLPSSPAPSKKSELSKLPAAEINSKNLNTTPSEDSEHQPKRPVPLPRKKSLGKCDTEELSTLTRPEVMPRKVFLTKPEVPAKPASAAVSEVSKPTHPRIISAKPSLPKKPKPPPKAPKPTLPKDSKDLDAVNANQPPVLENQTVSTLSDDLNQLDILKYIEQEQKSLESAPSLFD